MKYKNIIICFILLFSVISIKAQSKKQFALETDPIAFLLNGYSIHGIYQPNRFRFDLGFYGIKEPSFYSGNSNFDIRLMGLGVKSNYFLNKSETWFVGAGVGWTKKEIEYKNTTEKQNQYSIGLGVNMGFKFHLFHTSFYISPWVSVDYNILLKDVSFNNVKYNTSKISLFPTIHIGYAF